MPITLPCACGKSFRVKDELAGRKVRCPGCGGVLAVPTPEADVEAAALEALLDASAGAAEAPTPASRSHSEISFRTSEEHLQTAPLPRQPQPLPLTQRKTKPRKERRAEWSMPMIVVNREIVLGGLAILAAVAWFLFGLAVGRLYLIGPSVLFASGVGAIIRGFTMAE